MTNGIRQFSYTCSIYTIVGLTFERYLSYCHPDRAKHICTPEKVKKIIGFVSLLCFLYTIPVFCEHSWEITNGKIQVNQTVLMKEGPIKDSYTAAYRTAMNFLVRFVIPTICLVIFNIRIIREVEINITHPLSDF